MMLLTNFLELHYDEVRRIPLPRTPVNKGRKEGGRQSPALTVTTRKSLWRGCCSLRLLGLVSYPSSPLEPAHYLLMCAVLATQTRSHPPSRLAPSGRR